MSVAGGMADPGDTSVSTAGRGIALGGDADRQGARERRQRVLGRQPARAAVTLQVEGGGVGGHDGERREGGGAQHGLG